jgi:hypothetical protein
MFTTALKAMAHRCGVGVVSLPHGDSPYANRLFKVGDLDYRDWSHYGRNPADHIVVPNELTAQRFRGERPDEQIHVLGSARFNQEWLDVLHSLLPPFSGRDDDDSLRVLLFLRNPDFIVNWEEVCRAVELITNFRDVTLVVKHHTRHGRLSAENRLSGLPSHVQHRPNLHIIGDQEHSSSLIRWADAVLEIGTSITNEAVMLGKPVLSMEYLHGNVSSIARFLPGTAMRCRDDLFDALTELESDRHTRRYSDAERRRFISEMIAPAGDDVLDNYAKLLKGMSAPVTAPKRLDGEVW